MGDRQRGSMEAAAFQKIHTEAFHRKFWVQDYRPDGRKLNEPRQTHLQPGVLSRSHADGSAMARLGNTTVIAGVCAKLETVPPSDTHNTAQEAPPPPVAVHVEIPSLCSPDIRMSAPTPFHAQAIAHSAQQLIDRSGMIAQGALDAGVEGCYAQWRLEVHVVCTDDDGNLRDAAMLAMVCALANTTLPQVRLNKDGTVECDVDSDRTPLQLSCLPVPVTHGLVRTDPASDSSAMLLLMDPTRQEQDSLCAGGSLTLAFANGQLCLVLKEDGAAVEQRLIEDGIAAAAERANAVHAQFFAAEGQTAAQC